ATHRTRAGAATAGCIVTRIRRAYCRPRTARVRPALMIERSEPADKTERTDTKEPTESTETAEPTDPLDNTEPIEPTESNDPRLPMQSSESSDHSDHFELLPAPIAGQLYFARKKVSRRDGE